MAATLGAIERGDTKAEVRHRFIEAVSRHHLDYGHGAIYTQKAFELLDRVGWDRAPALLPHLAVGIATGIYDDRAFERMPILADALQEGGCDHADILTHCREPGTHVRGCWVVDLVLGKA